MSIQMQNKLKRSKQIVRISIYGILVNLVLVGFKATVGLIANSISIVLDAVNNLTDALSSIVTIIGVKLAGKKPDAKHPFGHGRIEYFSAVIVAMIVLAAGVMALKESIEKIIAPEEADYSVVSLTIVAVAVLVKFFFGRYVKRKGKELNSGSLVASGVDAISDAALSTSVLAGALISFIWHISLEGYIGLLIAVMIVRTAVEILRDGVNDLLGARTDNELATKMRETILENKKVRGVYDMALHNYGPNKIIASAHIELSDDMKTREIHKLSRQIEVLVYEKYGIILTLGVYASNDSGKAKSIKEAIEKEVLQDKKVRQVHGFYVDEENKEISFDVVFDYGEEEAADAEVKKMRMFVNNKYPDYKVYIIVDSNLE